MKGRIQHVRRSRRGPKEVQQPGECLGGLSGKTNDLSVRRPQLEGAPLADFTVAAFLVTVAGADVLVAAKESNASKRGSQNPLFF